MSVLTTVDNADNKCNNFGNLENGEERGKSEMHFSQSALAGAFIQTLEHLHSLQRSQSAFKLRHTLVDPGSMMFN